MSPDKLLHKDPLRRVYHICCQQAQCFVTWTRLEQSRPDEARLHQNSVQCQLEVTYKDHLSQVSKYQILSTLQICVSALGVILVGWLKFIWFGFSAVFWGFCFGFFGFFVCLFWFLSFVCSWVLGFFLGGGWGFLLLFFSHESKKLQGGRKNKAQTRSFNKNCVSQNT